MSKEFPTKEDFESTLTKLTQIESVQNLCRSLYDEIEQKNSEIADLIQTKDVFVEIHEESLRAKDHEINNLTNFY